MGITRMGYYFLLKTFMQKFRQAMIFSYQKGLTGIKTAHMVQPFMIGKAFVWEPGWAGGFLMNRTVRLLIYILLIFVKVSVISCRYEFEHNDPLPTSGL